MTVQKEIQNTPINFIRVMTALQEDIDIHSVFKEDSRRQLFNEAAGGLAKVKATAFQASLDIMCG